MNGRSSQHITMEAGDSPRRSPSPDRGNRQKFRRERERPAPYPKGGRRGQGQGPPYNRVLVSNIPYEEKWQVIKDLFRDNVGEVTYVELFSDADGKSKGYGVVEFRTKELCSKAVEVMNQHEIRDRKIVVKEDFNGDMLSRILRREQAVNPERGVGRHHGGHGGMPPPMHHGGMQRGPPPPPPNPLMGRMNDDPMRRYMNEERAPIGDTVFVANLDYKVTYSKLKEVFELAGRVRKVDILLDKENKSRGMATVSYEDASHAAQAISMLNDQCLYDRPMRVRMDKDNKPKESKLPEGLSGIGPALRMQPSGHSDMPSGSSYGGLGGLEDSFNINSILSSSSSLGGVGGPTGLPGLSQASQLLDVLKGNSYNQPLGGGAGGLGGLAGLASLNDLSRLVGGAADGRGGLGEQHRLLEEQRSRLLGSMRPGVSDRGRIDRDIAAIDNRIRDIDRSLADARNGVAGGRRHHSPNLPPLPPPMNSRLPGLNSGGGGGGGRMSGCTVFVRNLPFALTWQKLRDIFSKQGRVQFAEIKMENGRSRGFGHVRYESPEQADEAVRRFDGIDIDGRKIEVRIDQKA